MVIVQRLLGVTMVIFGTTGIGFLYGMELQRYLEKLQYMRHIIYMMKGEMEYTKAPLGEVFGRVSVRTKEPYAQWLKALETRVEDRDVEEFSLIWEHCAERHLAELHLKGIHMRQLKELGSHLGQLDSKTGSSAIELYLKRWETEIEKVREGLAAKKKLYNCLGVMGGIFLAVILL